MPAPLVYQMLPANAMGRAFELPLLCDPRVAQVVSRPGLEEESLDFSAGPADIEDLEGQLKVLLPFQQAPESERNVALLALYLHLRGQAKHPMAVPEALSMRACELIALVGSDYPDFITAPGVWNSPLLGVACAGTLVSKLLFADIDVRREWVDAPIFERLVEEAGCWLRLPGHLKGPSGAESDATFPLSTPVFSRHLYSAAGWMCENRGFLASLVAGRRKAATHNDDDLFGLIQYAAARFRLHSAKRATLQDALTPRAARHILERAAENHSGAAGTGTIWKADISDARCPRRGIYKLSVTWIFELQRANETADVTQMVNAVGALWGLERQDAPREFASCVVDNSFSGASGVGLSSTLASRPAHLSAMGSLLPLMQEMAMCGIRPHERPLYTVTGTPACAMLDRFDEALEARFGPDARHAFEVFCREQAMTEVIASERQQAGRQGGESFAAVGPATRRASRML